MARNKIEYHIQEGAFHTFKVQAGQTIKIGQPVTVTGDMMVSLAVADADAIGIVYSGTVGLDGVTVGYQGDNGDVVTVIVLKPIVYLTAGAVIKAGDSVSVGSAGKFAKTVAGPVVAKALTGATANEDFIALLGN